MRSWLVAAVLLVLLCAVVAEYSEDLCDHPGEMRRRYNCVAVRHTKSEACCWMKQDGTHGRLPYTCCGTGWKTSNCEAVIDHVCSTHPDDM